jgi:hypothetical protein
MLSPDANERSPNRCKYGTDQHIDGVIAKRSGVPAHLDAKVADFIMSGGVEQAREDQQRCGNEIHRIALLETLFR